MVALSMSPTTKPTSASGGGSPANASPSPTGGTKVGWDRESLPSPAFGTPTGSPYRPAFDASEATADDIEPEQRGGVPPVLALPSTPRLNNVTEEGNIGNPAGKLGNDKGTDFAGSKAPASTQPCDENRTATPSEEDGSTEEDGNTDACAHDDSTSGESTSSTSSAAEENGTREQDRCSTAVVVAPSSTRRTVSSHARNHHRSMISPPMQPPSACTTPSMSPSSNNHPRRRVCTGIAGGPGSTGPGGFETPVGSPWPATSTGRVAPPSSVGGSGSVNGGASALSAIAAAAVIKTVASNATGRNMQHPAHEYGREWKGPHGAGVGVTGEGAVLSPVSATMSMSPRAATSCSSPRALSPRLTGTGSPRAPYPEGLEWWTELELSPTKVDMPGLQRWRDSRRPSILPSATPSATPATGLAGGASAAGSTSHVHYMHHAHYRNRSHDSRGAGASGDISCSDHSTDGFSPLRPARLSRSYVTLLAAAAEEARALTPNGGRNPHAHAIHRSDSSNSASIAVGVAAAAAAAAANGAGGADLGEVSMEALARAGEEKIRRLEAENLRLRFRVADLEGQVSVMEDELDRRGGRSDLSAECSPRYGESRRSRREKSSPSGAGDSGGEYSAGDEAEGSSRRRGSHEPVLSPRGRGYLARLVLEVCNELEESKRLRTMIPRDTVTSGPIPRSERLCKVLPKVMETAIKGVRDLDEQVFEQMMQAASERMPAPPPPPPPGTPARRLSSCVVARDGGGEFFAQSPAPGRPASFFRLGDPQTPGSSLPSWAGGATPRGTNGRPKQGGEAASERRRDLASAWGGVKGAGDGGKNADTPSRWAAGEWWSAAFAPAASSGGAHNSPRARGATEHDTMFTTLPPPPRAAETQNILSFEGSAEEVLRYTIVAKSYLIRSRSKRHGDGVPSPTKVVMSPGGTARTVVEGDDHDMHIATKELLELKTRYMTATQHWLKTDIVNDEELRMIRAQVFEAIQRKRSELHKEAATVLRAERASGLRGAMAASSKANADSGRRGDIEFSPSTGCSEEEAKRTISMLAGTAELLKFSRLLLLLSEAIAASTPPEKSSSGSDASGDMGMNREIAAAAAKTMAGISTPVTRSVPRTIPATVPEASMVAESSESSVVIPENSTMMTPETAPGSESETDSATDSGRDSLTGRQVDSVSDSVSDSRKSRDSTEGSGPIGFGLGSIGTIQTPSRARSGKGRSSSSPPLRPKIRSIDICPE